MRFELRAILRTSHVLDFEREIRITCTVQILRRFTCGGKIQMIGWNNEFLLLAGDTFGSEFFSEGNMVRFDSGNVGVNVAVISWG